MARADPVGAGAGTAGLRGQVDGGGRGVLGACDALVHAACAGGEALHLGRGEVGEEDAEEGVGNVATIGAGAGRAAEGGGEEGVVEGDD